MISQALVAGSTNRYVQSLKEKLLASHQEPVQSLIIAHNNFALSRRLERAFAGPSVAILHMPQSSWDFQENELRDAISWAVRELGVEDLILVGHSQGGLPHDQQPRVTTGHGRKDFDQLLAGVKRSQARLHGIKKHLADQFTDLCQIPEVAQGLSTKELTVDTLLYFAESGSFMGLDKQSNEFHPLLQSLATE